VLDDLLAADLMQRVQVAPHLQRGSPCRTVYAPSSWPWTNRTYFPLGTQPTEMPEQVQSQRKGGAQRSAVPPCGRTPLPLPGAQ